MFKLLLGISLLIFSIFQECYGGTLGRYNLDELPDSKYELLLKDISIARLLYFNKLNPKNEGSACTVKVNYQELIELVYKIDSESVYSTFLSELQNCLYIKIIELASNYNKYLLQKLRKSVKATKQVRLKFGRSLSELEFYLFGLEYLELPSTLLNGRYSFQLKDSEELGLETEIGESLDFYYKSFSNTKKVLKMLSKGNARQILKLPILDKILLNQYYNKYNIFGKIIRAYIIKYSNLYRIQLKNKDISKKEKENRLKKLARRISDFSEIKARISLVVGFLSSDLLNLELYENIFNFYFSEHLQGTMANESLGDREEREQRMLRELRREKQLQQIREEEEKKRIIIENAGGDSPEKLSQYLTMLIQERIQIGQQKTSLYAQLQELNGQLQKKKLAKKEKNRISLMIVEAQDKLTELQTTESDLSDKQLIIEQKLIEMRGSVQSKDGSCSGLSECKPTVQESGTQ